MHCRLSRSYLLTAHLQITRKVACRLSPLQRQLYVDILARNFAVRR